MISRMRKMQHFLNSKTGEEITDKWTPKMVNWNVQEQWKRRRRWLFVVFLFGVSTDGGTWKSIFFVFFFLLHNLMRNSLNVFFHSMCSVSLSCLENENNYNYNIVSSYAWCVCAHFFRVHFNKKKKAKKKKINSKLPNMKINKQWKLYMQHTKI